LYNKGNLTYDEFEEQKAKDIENGDYIPPTDGLKNSVKNSITNKIKSKFEFVKETDNFTKPPVPFRASGTIYKMCDITVEKKYVIAQIDSFDEPRFII